MNSKQSLFRQLPSVDKLLQSELLQSASREFGDSEVKAHTRRILDGLRERLAAGDAVALERLASGEFLPVVCQEIVDSVASADRPSLTPVLNLSGTVLHTNLGRARLPKEAGKELQSIACQASNLEYDLEAGSRGDRDKHLQQDLCHLTGAEAVTVVNNNAAAVLLVLNTLAPGKEVLISRGELVEIGGSFRIPEVMQSAQAILREVGTTNRTHVHDYERAVSESTGLLMKVHTSNYAVKGFTAKVSEQELADLAHQCGLLFVSDLGSGTLVDLRQFGLPPEPTVRAVLTAGADLVTFSGDKLLGGVQAGVIAGRADLIQRIKNNPLKRALRVDKLTIAALAAVLKLYRDPERLARRLPFLRDVSRSEASIEQQAQQLLPVVRENLGDDIEVSIRPTRSQIGSGALPLDLLPSHALVLKPRHSPQGADAALKSLAKAFRELPTPVIGRIHDGEFWLDLRCLDDSQRLLELLPELEFQA